MELSCWLSPVIYLTLSVISFADSTNVTLNADKFQIFSPNKSSAGGLVGHENDAHFGKNIFVQLAQDQKIVYGYENEVYNLTFWIGKVSCTDDSKCDDRSCAGYGGKSKCTDDSELDKTYCECEYDPPSTFPSSCDPAKLVLQIDNIYYGKGATASSATIVGVRAMMTTCKFTEGETDLPIAPKPDIDFDPAGTGLLGRLGETTLTITLSEYIHAPGMDVYYWLELKIYVVLNKTNLGAILEKIGAKNFAQLVDPKFLKELVEIQSYNMGNKQ